MGRHLFYFKLKFMIAITPHVHVQLKKYLFVGSKTEKQTKEKKKLSKSYQK